MLPRLISRPDARNKECRPDGRTSESKSSLQPYPLHKQPLLAIFEQHSLSPKAKDRNLRLFTLNYTRPSAHLYMEKADAKGLETFVESTEHSRGLYEAHVKMRDTSDRGGSNTRDSWLPKVVSHTLLIEVSDEASAKTETNSLLMANISSAAFYGVVMYQLQRSWISQDMVRNLHEEDEQIRRHRSRGKQ
jgi:hypothetical protein